MWLPILFAALAILSAFLGMLDIVLDLDMCLSVKERLVSAKPYFVASVLLLAFTVASRLSYHLVVN